MNQPILPPTIRPLEPGEKIGAFEVMQRIGAGGSSIIYTARDSLLNRIVAIKQLLPTHDDAAFRQRFRQEAELQRRVTETHPGVVQLIDSIEHERGVFLVLEYVHGYTIEQLLMRTGNPIDATQALRVTWASARALQAIHDQGVLHRDLKPSNLIVTQADPNTPPKPGAAPYPVKIADLGVATLIAEQEAMNLGSVRYMAPELFGSTAADGRSDVYSLGLIFYEMLVGRSAFQEAFRAIFKDDRNQALRWMKWHTNARLQAPAADSLNPALPETLAQLVARAIAKDVHDRIATAGELAEAIERHFTTQGVAENIDQKVTARRDAAQSTAAVQAASDTAELPGAKTGARWRVPAILGGSLAVTLGLILAFSGSDGPSGAELDAMRASLVQADQAWRGGDLAAAESGYEAIYQTSLETDLPTDLAAPAHAGLLTVQVRRLMDEGGLEDAAAALGDLQQLPAADAETVDVLRRELRRRQNFVRYETDIVASLAAGRLAEARNTIESFRREGFTLSSDETDRLNELDAQEVGLRVRQAMQRDLDEVERLVTRDRVDEAVDDLRRMERKYAEPEVRQRLAELLAEQRYTQAMVDYQAALDDGDLPAAIRFMVLAQESRPDDSNLTERLSGLRVRDALARGQRAQAENRLEVAREAYAEALSYGSAPEALTALSRMDTAEERDALVRRADEAVNAGDFDLAINLYEAASGLDARADLAARLQRARVGRTLQQGEEAFARGDLATAKQRFEQVLRINPGNARAENSLRSVDQSAEYVRLVEQGDLARAGSRFGEAMNSYRAARELIHTEQVDELIDETEYQQLIAQARVALAQKDPRTARALLQTARGIRAGEIIDELMQQIRALESD